MRISDLSSDVCSSDLALLGLAVSVDDEHVRAGLIDDDCRLRDHQRLLRLCPLDDHADELTGDEQPLRIGQGRAEDHRVGRRIDLDIDEVDRPGRSEEHTSELQSLMRISYAVFCLKKKKNKKEQNIVSI